MEKAIRESSIEKFQIGNVYSFTEKKDYSYLCMWTILTGWQETEH